MSIITLCVLFIILLKVQNNAGHQLAHCFLHINNQ
jgi:hypothetical protein